MDCRIYLKEHLDSSWQEWLGGLTIIHQPSGTTLLIGSLPDQAALHGVLATLRRLNLSLLSLKTGKSAEERETADVSEARKKDEYRMNTLEGKRKGVVMNDTLTNYVNGVFAPYEEVKSAAELKADLLSDLQERFRELKAEGKDDETAFTMTVESIGDIEQTVREVANLSRSLQRQVAINLSASNLPQSDFAGVIAHQGKFQGSALRGSDFTGADLTGSSFRGSDVREANFAGANLTDCDFSTLDLTNASFRKSILVRTNFGTSGLVGAKFIDVTLTDVNLTKTDLRKTTFENCTFLGVDFKYSDLSGLRFDGQTFISVTFDEAALNGVSFQGATLKNVSFRSGSLWSKKYYRAIKTTSFDGAMMDKLTYAALKGIEVDVSKVTVLA